MAKLELISRTIRKAFTDDSSGIRKINFNPDSENQKKGFFSKVFSFVKGVFSGGFKLLFKLLSKVVITAQSIWGWFVGEVQYVLNLNLNMTQADLMKQFEAFKISLSARLGGAIGNTLGWAACGVLPGAVIFTFNEPLGLYILKEVGEEAYQEILSEWSSVLYSSFQSGFRLARDWIYLQFQPFYQNLLEKFFPDKYSRDKPFSIWQNLVEETIESLPPKWSAFFEELVEEVGDACIEAGYVAAGAIDSYYAQNKNTNNAQLGQNLLVEMKFNS